MIENNNKNTVTCFQVFDQLRFPLIILVVYIHSNMHPVNYHGIDFNTLTASDSFDLCRLSLGTLLSQIAVPVFFFISGFLFFYKMQGWDWHIYGKKIKRRVRTLFIPYVIWNSIAILFACILLFRNSGWQGVVSFVQENDYLDLFLSCEKAGTNRENELGIPTPMTFPYLVPLWYLRELMVMVLLSPVFYAFFKKLGLGGVFLLLISFVFSIGINIPGFLCLAMFFYGSGAFFSMNNIDPTHVFYGKRWGVYLITGGMFLLAIWFYNIRGIFYSLFIITGSISAVNIAIASHMKGIRIPQILTSAVFFIYLFHDVYITTISTYITDRLIGISNSFQLLIGYLLSPIISILICMIIFISLKRICPKALSLIAGGRC